MSRGNTLLVPGLGISYAKKIKNLFGNSIIGYWVGDEPNGAVAIDESGLGFNGAYTGVTLGQPGIGDGLTCPFYDGANDFMQPPAGFRTAFNGQLFSILWWANITSSVWADGTNDRFFYFSVNGSNLIAGRKSSIAGNITIDYIAGGTTKGIAFATGSPTIFFHGAVTVSLVDDALIAYYRGLQVGTTQTGLGTFAGTITAALTTIGADNATPINPFNGNETHFIVLNRAATPAEVAAAAVI